MKTILVSLVSDQTIPNILAIHYHKPDELLFISTPTMEKNGKTACILKALEKMGTTCQAETIMVQEDSIQDCRQKLTAWAKDKEDIRYLLNLTCGTKMMSIAAYEFFKGLDCEISYIPNKKIEFMVISPEKESVTPIMIPIRLKVPQYLAAYGLEVTNEHRLREYQQESGQRKDLSTWIAKNYDQLKNLLLFFYQQLKDYREKKSHSFAASFPKTNNLEEELLSRLGLSYDQVIVSGTLTKSVIKYITGGWLEEYCFNTIADLTSQGIDDVGLGLQLKQIGQGTGDVRLGLQPKKNEVKNEYDVMFTKDNKLIFIECKSLDLSKEESTNALYKIGALKSNDIGLNVESFFVTTSSSILENGKLKDSVQARLEQFKTTAILPHELNNLQGIIAGKLGLA